MSIFHSRKFWAALVGLAYSVIYWAWPGFPIPEESILGVVVTLVSYILGVALEDGLRSQQEVRKEDQNEA